MRVMRKLVKVIIRDALIILTTAFAFFYGLPSITMPKSLHEHEYKPALIYPTYPPKDLNGRTPDGHHTSDHDLTPAPPVIPILKFRRHHAI